MFCIGLLSGLVRKLVEPMALAVRTLQEFLPRRPWDEEQALRQLPFIYSPADRSPFPEDLIWRLSLADGVGTILNDD